MHCAFKVSNHCSGHSRSAPRKLTSPENVFLCTICNRRPQSCSEYASACHTSAIWARQLWAPMANEVQNTSHPQLLLSPPCLSDGSRTRRPFLKQNILLGIRSYDHWLWSVFKVLVLPCKALNNRRPVYLSHWQLLFLSANITEGADDRTFSRIAELVLSHNLK